MNDSNFEIQIVNNIEAVLLKFIGCTNVRVKQINSIAKRGQYSPDVLVEADLNGFYFKFHGEIKGNLDSFAQRGGLDRLEGYKDDLVLITDYISPKLAIKLKEFGFSYLDMAGNAFIARKGMHISREARNKPLVSIETKSNVGYLFNPSATRFVFQLLNDFRLLELPYRELMVKTKISIGSVKKAMDVLKANEFINDGGKYGMYFENKERLFDQWCKSYNHGLRKKITLGSYTKIEKSTPISFEDDACWGGDYAANKVTNNLESYEKVIYVYEGRQSFINRNKLIADPDGDIKLYEATWDKSLEFKEEIAPIMIVFADLLWTKDPRCAEIARDIFEKYISAGLNG